MRVTKTTLILVISMLFFSILLANVANILSTDQVYSPQHQPKKNLNRILKMSDSDGHLIWFLQISDLHISIFRDSSRISEFKEFCHYTLDIIKPSVVLATGDLTDAKTRDNIGSQQFEKEWQHYRDVLKEFRISEKTVWLDIRGNHDNFNVVNVQSKQNFYSSYSMQGKIHPRSYMQQLRTSDTLYSFIGIDACLEPGPRRPFNFVGILDTDEVTLLKNMIKKTELSGSNYTIWFGHFPTSCILAANEGGIRGLIGRHQQGLAYFCGHLHQLGGLIPRMYTLQQTGYLELELGDWKDNRMYRLAAIDHGIFSFVDMEHRQWPVVLITNPKDALFYMPQKEDLDVIRQSTHIRILAFSHSKIKFVKVRINDGSWNSCRKIKGPLYVTNWKPEKYETGLHNIHVHVEDEEGREKMITQQFSLDGTKLSFNILSRIVLMTNASTVFKVMFATLIVFSIFPLCLFRYLHRLSKVGKIATPNIRKKCLKLWVRKLWILSTVDRIFWPLVLYPLYLAIGPWSIGYIVEDHLGAIFVWGIFVNGTFLPGSFTYAYGFLQVLTFQIPLTLILANGVDHRFQYQQINDHKHKTLLGQIGLHLPFLVVLSVQVLMAYFFWLAYGTLAFFLGPLRLWSVLLAILLWHQALVLPEQCTREAAKIWSTKADQQIISQTDSSLNQNVDVSS